MVTTVAEAEIVGKNNEAAFKPLFFVKFNSPVRFRKNPKLYS